MESACGPKWDQKTSTMEILPREIVFDILSRLPTTSLHIVKLVCRSWRNLVEDPVLVNMHFTRLPENNRCLILHSDHPIKNQLYALHLYAHNGNAGIVQKISMPEMPEFDVIGSCNGWLALCESSQKDAFHLYNPCTSAQIELPKSSENSDKLIAFEFGFHPKTGQYKLVMIVNGTRNDGRAVRYCGYPRQSEVQILTLGNTTWRNRGQISYHLFRSPSSVLLNGRLHWISWPHRLPNRGKVIVSFDLEDERFREVQVSDLTSFARRIHHLAVLGGCLSAVTYCGYGLLEIWAMKDYGCKESWTKQFSIGTYLPKGLEQAVDPSFKTSKIYRNRPFKRVLCGLKNGEILLEFEFRALVSYDPKSGTFRDITVQGMPGLFEAVVHVGSLDSINALTVI